MISNPGKLDRRITIQRLKTSTNAVGVAIPITAIALGYPTILTAANHGRSISEMVALAGFAGAHAADLNGQNAAIKYKTTNTFAFEIDTTGRTITVGTATATPIEWTTQNAYGEPIVEWEDVATVWAGKRDMKGMERFAAQQVMAQVDTKFVIRYRSDVTPINRLVFEGRNYDIVSVLELGRRESLEILAVARAET
jgi:SPP1 family predicted phage head-tail adaptor